ARENADRIGAEADEGGMAERDQAAVTDQEIEGERGDRKDHHPRAEAEEVAAAADQRRRRDEREQDEDTDGSRIGDQPGPRPTWRERRLRHVSGVAPETARPGGRKARPPSAGR